MKVQNCKSMYNYWRRILAMNETYKKDEDFPTDLDWENRYNTSDYNAMVFYTSFAEIYRDELDDIRDRVGKDQENAIEAFADRLVDEPGDFEKKKEDMIELIRQNL